MSDPRPLNLMKREIRANHAAATVTGRITHDHRGNAVWDWAIETHILAAKTAAELLGTLTMPDIGIALEAEAAANGGWGGDPYNRPYNR